MVSSLQAKEELQSDNLETSEDVDSDEIEILEPISPRQPNSVTKMPVKLTPRLGGFLTKEYSSPSNQEKRQIPEDTI